MESYQMEFSTPNSLTDNEIEMILSSEELSLLTPQSTQQQQQTPRIQEGNGDICNDDNNELELTYPKSTQISEPISSICDSNDIFNLSLDSIMNNQSNTDIQSATSFLSYIDRVYVPERVRKPTHVGARTEDRLFGNRPVTATTTSFRRTHSQTSYPLHTIPNENQDFDIVPNENFSSDSLSDFDQNEPAKVDASSNISPDQDFSLIPMSVVNFYHKLDNSFTDFTYVYVLSGQMCHEILPMNSYVNLKMVLLLSLTSFPVDSTSNLVDYQNVPIPVVAIGTDFSSINRIMIHYSNIAQRFVRETILESGTLLLPKGGVCYIGDWTNLKGKQADSLLKAIECESINATKSNVYYQLQCAVWCYWSSFNIDRIRDKDRQIIHQFFEIFGVPIMLPDCPPQIIDFMLQQSMKTTSNDLQQTETAELLMTPLSDLKEYIYVVSQRKMQFTQNALDILQSYFIAKRTDQPECLTPKSLKILKSYAEGFAKLSFRRLVQTNDAIAAIYLVETSIELIFRRSSIYPAPQLTSIQPNLCEIDMFFEQFQNWLYLYIQRFTN